VINAIAELGNNENVINKIEFKHSSNIFLNSGIVALDYYLNEFKSRTNIEYQFELNENSLLLKSEKLLNLLEEIYYYMGKEIYDTCGKKAVENADKYYFIKEPFEARKFSKMKTYGLAGLITNDPQPTPRKSEDAEFFKNIVNNDVEFAKNISMFYEKNNLSLKNFDITDDGLSKENLNQKKGDSRIFINRPYTKTTSLTFNDDYFKVGDKTCYLTGEKYKKLVDVKSTSPFLAGLDNFNSNLKSDKNISWKAMYLSRFSPKLSFHAYTGGIDILMIYFFNSTNLVYIKKVFNENIDVFKDKISLVENSYQSNFDIYNFSLEKDISKDFTEQNEYLFMLIYSFYKQILEKNEVEIEKKDENWDPFSESNYENVPISIISFKANKFASTMRPDSFEEINNFKWLVRLFAYLETHNISIYKLLQSLKIIKPSERSSKNSYRIERQLRNKVLGKITKGKCILEEIELLFYNCFRFKTAGEYIGFKSYKDLFELITLYEKIILFGGNKKMNENLQQRAINLGRSIGQGILNFDNSENRITNAKNGKSYIIALKKARTQQQFLDEIIRIQTKYSVSVANDILESLNAQNFIMVKQFCIISALNQLNSAISIKKEKKNDKS